MVLSVILYAAVAKFDSIGLGRAIHGPMPVLGGTLEELSGPLVHTNFPSKRYGLMIGPYECLLRFVWTNGNQSSLKVSVLTGIGP